MFAILLLFCELKESEILWEKQINDFSEDIQFQICKNTENISFRHIDANIHNQALNDLESLLNKYGKCLKNFPTMPISTVLSNYK